jgi:hypothetical protein
MAVGDFIEELAAEVVELVVLAVRQPRQMGATGAMGQHLLSLDHL